MDFYHLWKEVRNNQISEISFFNDFLLKREASLKTMLSGSEEDLINMSKILLGTSIENFIENFPSFNSIGGSNEVIQFSNFNNALDDVCRIVKFEGSEVTYSMLGQRLVNAKTEIANKKYGENHSKLAAELSFVILKKKKSFVIENTFFGDFVLNLTHNERLELAKRLLLRNSFIRLIISEAKKGKCNYVDVASRVISGSTIDRRRSNVRMLVKLILENTAYDSLYDNIYW